MTELFVIFVEHEGLSQLYSLFLWDGPSDRGARSTSILH